VRKERAKQISKIKEYRKRLDYKMEEEAVLEKLVSMKKEDGSSAERQTRFNYLKRLKNRFDFRISTEANSLAKEKEMIRKISEINQELDELAVSVKMERKLGLVKGDIEECTRHLAELEPKIVEIDGKLDRLYTELRKKLGITRMAEAPRPQRSKEREQKMQQSQEINLEDIAVIKKKESK
jgi:uncharacterized coiled-coil DUF342 family protein